MLDVDPNAAFYILKAILDDMYSIYDLYMTTSMYVLYTNTFHCHSLVLSRLLETRRSSDTNSFASTCNI